MKATLWSLVFLLVQLTQTSQPQQQTGSIEGQVVRFGTTDGIARARVTLSGTQGSVTPKAVNADTEGKFAFRELAAGNYRLTVTRDGYVAAEYGQRGPSGSGVPITLTAQQQLRDVRIGMTQNGTIAGRVINRYGEPAGNANVQALKYTYQEGRRVLTPIQSVRTNDLGEYRLFWLTPGQYIVSAQPVETGIPGGDGATLFMTSVGPGGRGALPALGAGGITRIVVGGPAAAGAMPMPPPPPPAPLPPGAIAAESTEVSLPVYFPNTTDTTKAAAIDLRPGATYGGVDLTVVEARAMKVRGQVFSGGQPVRGATVSLYAKSTLAGFNIRSTSVSDTGTFEFRGLAPGTYELLATLNAAGPVAMIAGTPLGEAASARITNFATASSGPRMAARTALDVVNSDIEGVTLTLDAGFNVNGRVSTEGRADDPAVSNVRLQLQSDPNIPPLAIAAVNPGANGAFSIAGVTPGDYRLSITGLARNTYVKSARLGGADILNGGLRIDGEPRGLLEIVLGTNPGTLDALVVDDRQAPVSGVTVVLVPEATQQKRFEIYRNATTDSAGRIHLDGVVPGSYRIYAWEDIEANSWTDSEILRNFENRGTTVRIDEGGRANADVKLIPYKIN